MPSPDAPRPRRTEAPSFQALSSVASCGALTLGAGGDELEGKGEQPAAGEVLGREWDLREAVRSGAGACPSESGHRGVRSPDPDGAHLARGGGDPTAAGGQ